MSVCASTAPTIWKLPPLSPPRINALLNEERPHQGVSCANLPPRVAFPVLPTLPPVPAETPPPLPTSDPATLPAVPHPSPSTLRPEDPYYVLTCGHPISDLNVLTDFAPIIVRGVVTQVGPARWSTPDGTRPPNPHARDTRETIYRPVIVQVDEYLKGTQPHATVLLVARGGTVGHDSLDMCGDPSFTFTEGEQVVLFVYPGDPRAHATPRQTPGGPPIYHVGTHFTLTPDGQATSVAQQLPLHHLLDQIQAAQRR